MSKLLVTMMPALFVFNSACAEIVNCNAEPRDQTYLTEKYQYKVAGSGRLFLHTGPNEKCIDKNLFVIPGDDLTAYTEYGSDGKWSNVTFTSKTGKDYGGWVLTSRLMFTGAFGMEMTPAKVEYYRQAAAAAKAGKLGAP
jgi:hypothetical protein